MRRIVFATLILLTIATHPAPAQIQATIYNPDLIKGTYVIQDVQREPPVTPVAGDQYIVDEDALGAWEQHEEDIAMWNGTQWVFFTPERGRFAFVLAGGHLLIFNSAWGEIEIGLCTPCG